MKVAILFKSEMFLFLVFCLPLLASCYFSVAKWKQEGGKKEGEEAHQNTWKLKTPTFLKLFEFFDKNFKQKVPFSNLRNRNEVKIFHEKW